MPAPRSRRLSAALAVAVAVATALAAGSAAAAPAGARTPRVLRVGSWHGIAGQYHSIQAAVRAARPGDWVLVGPGDYHEHGYRGMVEPAGVLVTTPGIHLRGMDRNRVVVDGTRNGAPTCSPRKSDQRFTKAGRNGVEVYKVNGTYVENLTVCNFLTNTAGHEGNEIWWNGGDGSGRIGMGSFWGSYLTATSTYSNGTADPRGEYGIYADNERGPASIRHTYASNMGDSAYYVGACGDCNVVISDAHAQYSALGYSGTNSGGRLIVQHSEFDHNKTGVTTNSQNNDDAPSPQNGLCPHDARGPIGTGSCDIWRYNYVHDNNDPNVPGNGAGGLAGAAPVGAGFVLAGTEYVALYRNRVVRNGSWGVLVADLPDQEQPPPVAHCEGGYYVSPPPSPVPTCYYQAFGNQVLGNFFEDNGFFGNPTNGDIGLATTAHTPGNCVRGNRDPQGLSSDPPAIQSQVYRTCGQPNGGDMSLLVAEAECATQLFAPCPDVPVAAHYPRPTRVRLRMPGPQPTMPHPCAGVPANPWCPASGSGSSGTRWSMTALPGGTGPWTGGLAALAAAAAVVSRARRRLRAGRAAARPGRASPCGTA